jgi:hypothetical protein
MQKKDEDDYRPFVVNLSTLFVEVDNRTKISMLETEAKNKMEYLKNPEENISKIKNIYTLDEKKYKDMPEKEKEDVYITRAKEDYKSMQGQYLGFLSTMNLLKVLWSSCNLDNIKDKLAIGLIKDTNEYGNTSVSMGAAVEHFSKHNEHDQNNNNKNNDIVFLNCGTGGIKYQHYVKQNGIIRIEKEHKPQNQTGPNSLKIGDIYTPSKIVEEKRIDISIPFERNQLQFVNELTGFLSGLPDKENKPTSPLISLHAPIVAFVTGTVREKWETASKAKLNADIEMYDNYMEKYFGGFPENDQDMKSDERIAIKIPYPSNERKSYYMTQNMEGNLELSGTRHMYNNILSAKKLNVGTAVVASVGIGRGSCQFSIYNDDVNKIQIFGVDKGMTVGEDQRDKLIQGFGEAVKKGFNYGITVNNFLNMCNVSTPVIALKSGASLFFENNPDIKYSLLKLANPPKTIIS